MANPQQYLQPLQLMPRKPIHRVMDPMLRFLHIEAAGGGVLLAAAVFALAMANSPFSEAYLAFWKTPVGIEIGDFQFRHSLQHWVNDGLMAIFFFVVGMEVKREIVYGELNSLRRAALPIAAAVGGMVIPAGIYLALQWNQPGRNGWGIPMATDIAFVVGCMALLGPRVPHSLRVLLLSLAIVDDIGAILVIALGYTSGLDFVWLSVALGLIAFLRVLNWLGVRSFTAYMVMGGIIWFFFHESGVHATIAGVFLGLMTPAKRYIQPGHLQEMVHWLDDVFHGEWGGVKKPTEEVRKVQRAIRETVPPVEFLQEMLHPWVSFVIMPVFALANAGVVVQIDDITSSISLAIIAGLVLGKPLGIVLTSLLAVKLKLAELPPSVSWKAMVGGGCLAGIGFTMALFIASLAVGSELIEQAKVGILTASAISAVIGLLLLVITLPRRSSQAVIPGEPTENLAAAQETVS